MPIKPGEIMDFSLKNPRYAAGIKLRGRCGLVCALSARDASLAARILKRVCTLDQGQHVLAACYHLARAKRLDGIWSQVANKAAQQAFNRPWEFTDYKVCAIGRTEFAARHLRVLRHCAYTSPMHMDVARAHAFAAGVRENDPGKLAQRLSKAF
jgi:hypothetical protein